MRPDGRVLLGPPRSSAESSAGSEISGQRGTGERPRLGRAGLAGRRGRADVAGAGRRGLRLVGGHGDRDRPRGQPAIDFLLDEMRQLARAGLGEVHAVAGAQPPCLALEVGAGLGEAAVLVDEAVPDVDVDDARLVGAAAVELVEERDVAGVAAGAHRGQADPEDRNAGGLERGDGVVDALDIGLAPGVGAELVGPCGRGAGCRRIRCGSRLGRRLGNGLVKLPRGRIGVGIGGLGGLRRVPPALSPGSSGGR